MLYNCIEMTNLDPISRCHWYQFNLSLIKLKRIEIRPLRSFLLLLLLLLLLVFIITVIIVIRSLLSHLPSWMASQFVPCGRSYDQKKPLVFAAEGGHPCIVIMLSLEV